MEFVARENIKRYEKMLIEEKDPARLEMLQALLDEEREKLRSLQNLPSDQPIK